MRRPPAKESYIKEILEDGERYAIEGIVVSFDPKKGEGVLDDGTGVVKVVLENFLYAEDLREGSYVRVVGKGYLTGEGRLLRAEVVHPISVPVEVYKRVKELERRVYYEGGV